MAVARTWNLRLNLDGFNALVASFYADADRALALQGMGLGMNGGEMPEGAPPAFLKGWEFGASMRREAEEYRDGRRENGKSGGRPKKPHGLPHGEPEGIPHGDPCGEPNPQSTIHNPITNNDTPPTPKGARVPRVMFSPEMYDHMIPVEFAISGEFVRCWHDWVQDRKVRGKPISEIGAKTQLDKLSKDFRAAADAIACIRQSIANGWQGLFPVASQQSARPFPGRPAHAGVRAATDQALIDQMEAQNASTDSQPAPERDAKHDDWFSEADLRSRQFLSEADRA